MCSTAAPERNVTNKMVVYSMHAALEGKFRGKITLAHFSSRRYSSLSESQRDRERERERERERDIAIFK